jgi:hypothetical protein
MDTYHAWWISKPDHVKALARIEGWRLKRRKLGFGPPGVGEFPLMIEVRALARLEPAFQSWPGGASQRPVPPSR